MSFFHCKCADKEGGGSDPETQEIITERGQSSLKEHSSEHSDVVIKGVAVNNIFYAVLHCLNGIKKRGHIHPQCYEHLVKVLDVPEKDVERCKYQTETC